MYNNVFTRKSLYGLPIKNKDSGNKSIPAVFNLTNTTGIEILLFSQEKECYCSNLWIICII